MHGPMHGLRLQPHGVSLYGGMGMVHGQHLTRLKSIALRNRTTWTCFARNRQRAILSDQYGKSQMNIVGTLVTMLSGGEKPQAQVYAPRGVLKRMPWLYLAV